MQIEKSNSKTLIALNKNIGTAWLNGNAIEKESKISIDLIKSSKVVRNIKDFAKYSAVKEDRRHGKAAIS